MWIYLASIIAGAVLGTFFILVWRRCVDTFSPPQFWNTLSRITGELLRVDAPDELWRIYRKLFSGVSRYTAGNVIGLIAGLLPVVLLLSFIAPVIDAQRNRELQVIEVYPANIATLSRNETLLSRRSETTRTLFETGDSQEATLTINSARINLNNLRGKTAVCWSYWYCALFRTFGFHVIETESSLTDAASYIAVRPDRSKYSLLWPVLDDIESIFLLAFIVTNVVVLAVIGRSAG